MTITIKQIEAALYAEDIEGLIAQGAPADEYDAEAEAISLKLADLHADEYTLPNLTITITIVWATAFHLDGDSINLRMPAFQNVARALLPQT